MTLLVVSVFGTTVDEVRGRIEAALAGGAEMIELRLDMMADVGDDDVRSLRESTPATIPFILTIRSTAEGGDYDGTDDQRISRLIEIGPWAEYLDIELALWRRSANLRQKIGLALHRAGHISHHGGVESIAASTPRKLILSRHDVKTRPTGLQKDLVEMLSEPACDVPKVAWRARSIRDCFEAFEIMRDSPRPVMAICMGEEGLISRVLAKKFGAAATFASLGAGLESAEGQLSLIAMQGEYRWDRIGPATCVYGVVGDPVRYSLSPRIHNAALAAAGIDAVYLPMLVRGGYESFKAFMVEVLARPWLGFGGLSVTMPHKVSAFNLLNERRAALDSQTRRIGAVNTIKIETDGRLSACNTDAPAAIDALCKGMKCSPSDLKGVRCFVLGAGGMARAIVAELVGHGAQVSITNRTQSRSEALAREFGTESVAWDDRVQQVPKVIVNCTRVGQAPNVGESPMPEDSLRPGMVVFDTVYQPRRTALLKAGVEHGCTVVDGCVLFEMQAARQFEFWTGRRLAGEVFKVPPVEDEV
jgi:3-dehydroquinate dehydratase/shikimate dehydrogenase